LKSMISAVCPANSGMSDDGGSLPATVGDRRPLAVATSQRRQLCALQLNRTRFVCGYDTAGSPGRRHISRSIGGARTRLCEEGEGRGGVGSGAELGVGGVWRVGWAQNTSLRPREASDGTYTHTSQNGRAPER
jgi:hypothetical protein